MRDFFLLCVCGCVQLVDVGLIQDAMAAVFYNYLGARSGAHSHIYTDTYTDYFIMLALFD